MSSPKMSIIVPYRDREAHLNQFIPYMKNFLDEKGVEFHIFIVNQSDDKPFNRAKLLNIGFVETKDSSDYFCFHDVDMLPINSDYSYPDTPTHLASEVQQFNWGLAYDTYFGGVTLFNKEDFEKINGYSNNYWGWGAEDDDLWNRCSVNLIFPHRRVGRYLSLAHERKINEDLWRRNYEYLKTQEKVQNKKEIIDSDGLSSLEYNKVSEKLLNYYSTRINVTL